jgi:hypothetical protein
VIETDGPYVVFRWPAWSEHPIIIMIGETEDEVRSVCPVDLENEDGWIYEGCTELGGNDPYLHTGPCSTTLAPWVSSRASRSSSSSG